MKRNVRVTVEWSGGVIPHTVSYQQDSSAMHSDLIHADVVCTTPLQVRVARTGLCARSGSPAQGSFVDLHSPVRGTGHIATQILEEISTHERTVE